MDAETELTEATLEALAKLLSDEDSADARLEADDAIELVELDWAWTMRARMATMKAMERKMFRMKFAILNIV